MNINLLSIQKKLKEILTDPLFYILLFAFILYTVGINWGLPNKETWQSDSLAPFHPLVGLSKGFSFGYFNKYPIVHQVILAVLYFPIVVAALINSNPLEGLQIFKFLVLIRSAEYATILIYIGRFVSVLMGIGIIYYAYKSAYELFNRTAGLFAAIIVALNGVMNHYSHIAKVEVPYIFWAMIAIYYMIKIVKYENVKDYIYCAIFICLSFGTKDQAYALFIFPLILYLIVFQILYREDSKVHQVLFRKNLIMFGIAFIVGTVIVENIVLNFEGFQLRLAHLTGDGGQRSIGYSMGISGIFLLFKDCMYHMANHAMGFPFFIISISGLILLFKNYLSDKKTLIINLIFLVTSISYYVFFIQVIRQDNVRFTLPIGIFLSVYGGYFLAWIFERVQGKKKIAAYAGLLFSIAWSLYITTSVNANYIMDIRYTTEKWMEQNITPGSRIEYYSYLHYLPRFPEKTSSYRVKKNVLELEKRNPDYIVLTSHYHTRYLSKQTTSGGKIRTIRNKRAMKSDFAVFFPKLINNELNYETVKVFKRDIPFFQTIGYTKISPKEIIIFRRKGLKGDDK